MNEKKTLRGGVIVSPDQHTHAIIQLLSFQLQQRMQLSYYSHPNELELPLDLLIVLSTADLEGAIKVCRVRQQPVPYMIYIDEPETVEKLDYAALFPTIEITPVPHAWPSKGQHITLQIDLFRTVIELLEARM